MSETTSCCDTDDNNPTSRDDVRNFYSKAAVTSQENLCCPTKYDGGDLSHIPAEVLEVSYGCGSPVSRANIQLGETMVDLGSGGGIDCFIAAKSVGATGRVYGIDMTDEMLEVARKNSVQVTENLGYNNVEFKQGFLEAIPLSDGSADLVTSNCVINLSVNKHAVFEEILRVLKPGGRFVISDIISEKEVPEEMKNHKELWGECISGALTLSSFIDSARQSGFQGLQVSKDYLWKVVEGIKFYSYTIEGHKISASKEPSCCKSLNAMYSGPFESVTVGGNTYPAGADVDIDEATAEILGSPPFADLFILTDPELEAPAEKDSASCCD